MHKRRRRRSFTILCALFYSNCSFRVRWRHINSAEVRRRILSPDTSELLSTWPLRVLIGEIDWQVDHTNDALVDSAVRTLGVGHFGNQFEFGRLRKSCNSFARNIGLLKGNLWVMDANQLLMAREIGIIDKLPFLASDDLDDRNKQDLFLKLIAIGQTSWFTIDINVRWSRHLSVSLLELMVFAFATCTVFTYLLLLEKPNNATYTITIPATRHPRTAREITRLALAGPMVQGWPRKSIWIPNNALHLDFDMGNSKLNGARQRTIYAAAASLLIFGPIHCIG